MNLTDPDASVPESIVRHRPFQLYWAARVFNAIAFQMVGAAVGWQMYSVTNDPFDLGLVGLVQFTPAIFLVLVAGQAVDRYDRRRILQLCQGIEAIGAAALAIGSFTGWINKEFILAAVFLLGIGRAFEITAIQAILPGIVSSAMLPRAVAASSSAQQAATIGGPAIGGILYLVSPVLVYGICFVLFVCAGFQITLLRIQRVDTGRPPLTPKMFFAGISFIRHHKIVLGVISLDLFAVLLGAATALLPVFARDVFHADSFGFGLLRGAPAVGALLVVIGLARWPTTRHIGRTMFVAIAAFGVATIVFGVSRSFWLSMAALAVLGGSDAVGMVIRQSIVMLATPDEMRGRVSSVNGFFVNMSNQLGDFRAGAVAAVIGAVPAVLVGGLCTLTVVAVWRKVFHELYEIENYRSLQR
jgi:MFS family permease